MFVVSVLYPASEGAKFDFDYYMNTHIPLVKRLWAEFGLRDIQVLRGAPGPDKAPPPYRVIALVTFPTPEAFKGAAKAHGQEVFADIPNFTDISAIVQLNDVLG